ASVFAAAAWALGGSLDGATVAIESPPAKPAPEGLADGFTAAGAQVTDPDPVDLWPAPVDCLVIGSKPGLLSHESAERVTASVIVPWGPVPLTTRALAILHRNSTTYVPDFLSAGGGLLLLAQSAGADVDPVLRLLQARDELGPPSTDGLLFLRAAERAEAFLRTWQQDTPFGRPLV
ncbi:MAG: hypothetical protein OER95_09145, partial [Acidimicrobiia bacterium]|nr:hypothetical protein [Acidimicrobiia bacterium]